MYIVDGSFECVPVLNGGLICRDSPRFDVEAGVCGMRCAVCVLVQSREAVSCEPGCCKDVVKRRDSRGV